MTPRRVVWVVLAAGLGALVVSCIRLDSRAQDGRIALLEDWGADVIVEGYAEFGRKSADLARVTETFCRAPDAPSLEAVRSAWWTARGRWKRMEVFAFGPYSDVPLRIGPQIDFWPARPETIEALLAGPEPLTAEAMPGYGAAARGLPAIEVVLWRSADATLAELQDTPRRCQYLQAATADLVALAESMRAAWDPDAQGYLLELTYPGENGSMYMGPQEALAEVVNRIGFTLENLRNEKLGRPLGLVTGEAQPDKTESFYSDRAAVDVLDVLDGIELVLEGGRGGASEGLQDYLRKRGRNDFEGLIRLRLAEARAAVEAIAIPIRQAVLTEPDRVQTAIDALGAFQRLIQTDVIAALSLSLAFNDADGD